MKKTIISILFFLFVSILSGCSLLSSEDKQSFVSVDEDHEHVYDQALVSNYFKASDASCTEPAKYYYSCVCGKRSNETFDYGSPLGHDFSKEDTSTKYQKGENEETGEIQYYYACSRCGKKGEETYDSAKYNVTLNIDFTKNLLLAKYDLTIVADFDFIELKHGTSFNKQYKLDKGQYLLIFEPCDNDELLDDMAKMVALDVRGNEEYTFSILMHTDSMDVSESSTKSIKFRYNDGVTNDKVVKVKKGDYVNEPSSPSREGYYFRGWYSDGELYDFSSPVYYSAIIYAKWEKKIEVEVTFVPNNGQDSFVVKGYKGSTIERPEDPVYEGYALVGWYLGDQLYDFNTLLDAPITLEAKWEVAVYFNVTFDPNNGQEVTSTKVLKGKTITKPADPNPSDSNYVFDCWKEDGVTFDFSTKVYRDYSLVASYKEYDKKGALVSHIESNGTYDNGQYRIRVASESANGTNAKTYLGYNPAKDFFFCKTEITSGNNVSEYFMRVDYIGQTSGYSTFSLKNKSKLLFASEHTWNSYYHEFDSLTDINVNYIDQSINTESEIEAIENILYYSTLIAFQHVNSYLVVNGLPYLF